MLNETCGDARLIRPSLGSWVTYGLGSDNQNLPGFIAMCPGGYPIQETQKLAGGVPAGRLPGHLHRHAAHAAGAADRARPQPGAEPAAAAPALDLLRQLNETAPGTPPAGRPAGGAHPVVRAGLPHAARRRGGVRRRARATARPQPLRPRVQARQLLIARRLLEKGVRFIPGVDRRRPAVGQPRRPGGEPPAAGARLRPGDRGAADGPETARDADSTLVVWGGEVRADADGGVADAGANAGRVNAATTNHYGFSMWLAGGGVRGGIVHGANRRVRFQAVATGSTSTTCTRRSCTCWASTNERLTYRYAGRDFRLTDVHGQVVRALLA